MKYLFVAHYSDGTTYEQTPDDISTIKEGKSAYYDINHDKLIAFALSNQEKTQTYTINLQNGDIILNGAVNAIFKNHNLSAEPYRLIYYRHNSITTGSPNIETIFCIGWQTNINGENIKRILEIS